MVNETVFPSFILRSATKRHSFRTQRQQSPIQSQAHTDAVSTVAPEDEEADYAEDFESVELALPRTEGLSSSASLPLGFSSQTPTLLKDPTTRPAQGETTSEHECLACLILANRMR